MKRIKRFHEVYKYLNLFKFDDPALKTNAEKEEA